MIHPHSEEAHTHDPGAEDFPRLELNRLVGESQVQTRMRRRWQAFLLSLGLLLVALGLPTERYFGGLEGVWNMAGSGSTPQSVMALPILGTHALFGLGVEPASFLWSALLLGYSLFLLLRLMHRIGFDHEIGLTASLLAVISPLAWLGGTLPIDFSAGLLGSTLLCTSLFQTEQRSKQGYLWRAASYLLLAFLLLPENIWLAPAAIWAVNAQAKDPNQGRGNAFSLTVVGVACLWISVTSGGGHWSDLWHSIMGPIPGSSSLGGALVFWISGLGFAWLGLFHLLFGRREAEEQPAPTWVLAWIVVGVAPLVAGGLNEGPRGAFLLPIAAVGLADWLTRRAHVEHRSRWSAALLACQLLLTAGCVCMLEHQDPEQHWSEAAQEHFQEDDLFVSPSPARAYLARFRQGVSTCQIDAQGRAVHRSNFAEPAAGGLVLDGWEGAVSHPALAPWVEEQLPPRGPQRRPTQVLKKEGLIPALQRP